MIKELARIDGVILDQNPWWQYRRDRYRLPSGEEGVYYFVHTPGSVMIVPVTRDGRLIFCRQFRYLNQRISIEFPGGGVKKGMDTTTAARLELEEECGVTSDTLQPIGSFNPMNGVTDELCSVFIATDLKPVMAQPDITEEFEVVLLTRDEVDAAIGSGELWDGMTLAALALYRAITQ